MGRTFSICSEDWSALFGELASEVSASAAVPCTVELPAAPAGKALDFSLVNVLFTEPGADDGEALPRVDGATACGNKRGWYYDDFDAPSDIVLCPSSCKAAEEGGSLEVSLGCATIGQ